jgi:hypothetical protein
MNPFDGFPGADRELLGGPGPWDNCRHGYGLDLQRKTGQRSCASCGLDFTGSYEHWLLMAVDHVVPTSVGTGLGIPIAYLGDCINLVLACSGCNGFANRYKPALVTTPDEWTLEVFIELRDRVFSERRGVVASRRASERAFFEARPWQIAPA